MFKFFKKKTNTKIPFFNENYIFNFFSISKKKKILKNSKKFKNSIKKEKKQLILIVNRILIWIFSLFVIFYSYFFGNSIKKSKY